MNIKNIFITTGISVLFGMYSIYNLFEYFRVLNDNHIKQIKDLQHKLSHTNKKYNNMKNQNTDLEKKYSDLEKNYTELEKNYADLKQTHNELIQLYNNLSISFTEYVSPKNQDSGNENEDEKDNDNISIIISNNNDNISDIFFNHTNNNNLLTNNVICDELCNLNDDIPRIKMYTSSVNSKINNINFDNECINYDYSASVNEDTSSLCNSDILSIKSRSRSTSITEINWINLTKKFFFG